MPNDQATITNWRNRDRGSYNKPENNKPAWVSRVPNKTDNTKELNNGEKNYRQQWREAKNEQKNLKKINKYIKLPESAQEVLNKSLRLGTYKLYCLAWKMLIKSPLSALIAYLYLFIHFCAKYIGSNPNFCNFVSIMTPDFIMTKTIEQKEEKTDWLMFGAFLFLTALLGFIIILILELFALPFQLIDGIFG